MKILVADDDARMRQMLRQIVSALATVVDQACDGREAIDTYVAERPDWVLMDLRMKPVDGFRATSEITSRFPDARVVIVSQDDDPELIQEAARVGACAYVLKENLHELPGVLCGEFVSQAALQAKAFTSTSALGRPARNCNPPDNAAR